VNEPDKLVDEDGGMRRLVEQARDGDLDAFSQLASATIADLFAVARLILRDTPRAEDAVQDALVEAWRSIRGLRDPDRFDAWMHRLLVRACHRVGDRQRRRSVVELHLLETDAPRLEDDAATLANRDELERGFRRLPLDQRAVVVLHFYRGLPLVEVAQVLGIPTGTAKSRLHRATRTLRAALEADAREPGLSNGRIA
jgi:RNA polymerase sigma-70 factor, ECF subfamily